MEDKGYAEAYFILFDMANGFELLDLLAFELSADDRWFRVISPANRVAIVNAYPVYLLVIARRIQDAAIIIASSSAGIRESATGLKPEWKLVFNRS